MSETINREPAHIAPLFPAVGHGFPTDQMAILEQRHQQLIEESEALRVARTLHRPSPCTQVLNVSLFFDGTNNHEKADSRANPPHPSNIARLYHATINSPKALQSGYYTYYINGVGVEFKEIGETEPSAAGLTFASGGENRIDWGLLRLVDVLKQAVGLDALKNNDAKNLLPKMQATPQTKTHRGNQGRYEGDNLYVVDEPYNGLESRRTTLTEALKDVTVRLHHGGGFPTICVMKLCVYGFSRGAAEARTFINWLNQLCKPMKDDPERLTFFGVEIKVQFLGLMDTVASVGLAPIVGTSSGHMDWAGGTMSLPANGKLVKNVAHMVSAHEQRLSFALDSTRLANGQYPPGNLGEWVYPGMHSDVGGGYAPGEQGKAMQPEQVLSQIALHHMYQLAFAHNAPLLVDPSKIISEQGNDTFASANSKFNWMEPWRFMNESIIQEFDIDAELITRFNQWATQAKLKTGPLENILQEQTAHITAWRIARWANGPDGQNLRLNQMDCRFLKAAKNDPQALIDARQEAWDAQLAANQAQQKAVGQNPGSSPVLAAAEAKTKAEASLAKANTALAKIDANARWKPEMDKTYEPTRDQQQLAWGVHDFVGDYRYFRAALYDDLYPEQLAELQKQRRREGALATLPQPFLALLMLFAPDLRVEKYDIVRRGNDCFDPMIKDKVLLSLYDDHIHDSRCWFLQNSALGSGEPNGSYFRHRTVYYGEKHNKLYLDLGAEAAGTSKPIPRLSPDVHVLRGNEGAML